MKGTFRALLEAVRLVKPGQCLELDVADEAALLEVLAQGEEALRLPEVIAALPNPVLVLIQNVGRQAYRELLNRIAASPEYHQRIARSPSRVDQSQSSVMQNAFLEQLKSPVVNGDQAEQPKEVERVVRSWPRFASPDMVMAYYKGICSHQLFRAWKKSQKRAANEAAAGMSRPNAEVSSQRTDPLVVQEDHAIEQQRLARLDARLATLPLDLRLVYMLHQHHHWTFAAIDDLLHPLNPNQKPDTVGKRISRKMITARELLTMAVLALNSPPNPDESAEA